MPTPTVSIGFSPTTPAADPGFVNAGPRGDGGAPLLRESFQFANVGGTSIKTGNYTAAAADNGTLISFADSSPVSAHTLTLPPTPSTLPATPTGRIIWKIKVQNTGTAVLTIDRNGKTIDGATTNPTLTQGSGMDIFTDGTNYFTERGGQVDVSGLATKAAVQQESYTYAVDTGTANAYAVALSPAPTVGAGSVVQMKVAHAPTGPSTLAVNGGSATPIKKQGSAAFVGGEWQVGQVVELINDGTNWQWTGVGGASTAFSLVEISLTPSSPGNFTVAHGLGVTPTGALIQMTSDGQVWFQAATQFDSTNLYLTASDAGVTGKAVVFYAAASNLAVGNVSLTPSSPGNFTVAHGLGVTPTSAAVQMTSDGAIWFQTPTRFDSTNLYLVASDAGVTGNAVLFH